MVDDLARNKPDKVFGCWHNQDESLPAASQAINYSQLANIVNQLSWWLLDQLGQSRQNEVLTYVGPNDVRFPALVLASIKTGFKLFLTSPRNSSAAHHQLFTALKCHTLISPDPLQQPAQVILKAVKPCQLLTIPSVGDLLQMPHKTYIMKKSLEESFSDALVIIHTSGSTGIPKPLTWTQGTAVRFIEANNREPPPGLSSINKIFNSKRVLSTLPPFHGAGLVQFLIYAIAFGNTVVIPPSNGGIMTVCGVVDALKRFPADVAIMAPLTVAELAQDPESLHYCAQNLELILYAGGDLPQAVGDIIVASGVSLRCCWGASEVGIPQHLILPELETNSGDWHYISFHPNSGATFEKVDDDSLYELVFRRDETIIDTQMIFTMEGFENLTEYHTRDLFEQHPTVPNAWRWRARADDLIVFLNGEKTNPISMEQSIVAGNANIIRGAVMVGAQRFQAALIVEPVDQTLTAAGRASLIERLWPSIDQINKNAPAHARLEKALIMVAQQPFCRAGKGTVQRAATIERCAVEIEKLYASADCGLSEQYMAATDGEAPTRPIKDIEAATELIRDAVRTITNLDQVAETHNLFESGMDSLQALRLARVIRTALRYPNLSLSRIYQNPTPRQLAMFVVSSSVESNLTDDLSENNLLESLLDYYQGQIREIATTTTASLSLTDNTAGEARRDTRLDVLLTGSTGTLGTSILSALLAAKDRIGNIFCLNRRSDGGRAAQYDRFVAAQLDVTALDGRVTFLHATLTEPRLGLSEEAYRMLGAQVGLVIHNAWAVNFNFTLSTFRPLLAGLVNLFKFASNASLPSPRIIFISSIGAMAGMESAAGGIPESIPDKTISLKGAPLSHGYARSKLLGELLCDYAVQHLKISVAVLRIGQIGGSTTPRGALWNPAEWVPSLIISSARSLNCLPDSLGPRFSEVDWVPSDLLGVVVADLALASPTDNTAPKAAEVFNVRNPRTTTWGSLVPTIQETVKNKLGQGIEVVPHAEWLARLIESERQSTNDNNMTTAMSHGTETDNPAIKLIDFYQRGLWPQGSENVGTAPALMVIKRSMAVSAALRDMPSISSEWMRKWVVEWMDS
ncbi:putative NRPS-like enzyme [Xylariaceae sp. FL0255]|nr:putative NRPS-like enzyme [Xylariaceae sp. FL0255]